MKEGHDRSSICPGCGKDCSQIALVKLVYTFRPCACKAEPFKHLVETSWHKDCYLRSQITKLEQIIEEEKSQ